MSEEGSAVDVIRTLHCSRELKSMNYSHLVHILLSNNTIIIIIIYIYITAYVISIIIDPYLIPLIMIIV